MTDITEIMKLKAELDNLSEQMAVLDAKHKTVWKLIKTTCTHPTTIKKSLYHHGDKYGHSTSLLWDECTICKSRLNSRTELWNYG
jgi:hypothetical protein